MVTECRREVTIHIPVPHPEEAPLRVTFDPELLRGATLHIGVIPQNPYLRAAELMVRGLVEDVYQQDPLGFVARVEDPNVTTPNGRMVAVRELGVSNQITALYDRYDRRGIILIPFGAVLFGGKVEINSLDPNVPKIVSNAVGGSVTAEALCVSAMLPELLLRVGLAEDDRDLARLIPAGTVSI